MLVLFVIVILVALALQWYSVRNASDHRAIHYECGPSVRSCEPGKEFFVYSTVSNSNLRSSPVIRIDEHFPRELEVLESEQYSTKLLTKDHRIYRSTVLVRGKQKVRRYLRASIAERGEYRFSYADFHTGDFLGFKEFDYRMNNESSIVIYPAAIENDSLLKAFCNSVDEIAHKKQLLEDPLSVCGYRDYTGREPMRSISWKQSAIRRTLIVKQFDPVWQESVCIALDMGYHGDYDMHYPRQEVCFSIARTVCDSLERRRVGYRLFTNAIIADSISSFTSPGGFGAAYSKILFALGSAKNGEVCTSEELISAVCSGADRQKIIVYIATRRGETSLRAIAKAKQLTGGSVLPIFAEDLLPGTAEEPGGEQEPSERRASA
jgi:Uncharacterized conserved protein (some members contain a von Willebrand factor type A (vWA) domain)